MLAVRETTLDFWTEMIDRRLNFTFSRWGDGEWHSVFGRASGRNCDGHEYFPAMGERLRSVLLSRPDYPLGMQPLAQRVFGDRLEQWVMTHQLHDLDWVNADVLHTASSRRQLEPFLAAFRACPSVVVGPPHLRKLKDFLGYRKFVDVPPRNSFLALDDLFRSTMGAIDGLASKVLVSVSAGMPAKILIDMLHHKLKGQVMLLDAGSLFDVYAGVRSRRYMQHMDVEVEDAL